MKVHREVTMTLTGRLLGVVTPFCSCSAVPLFLGFVEVGIPLGVTLWRSQPSGSRFPSRRSRTSARS
jgi:uncharacterized membrane protein YraQ (UPF0718 family)